MGEHREAHYRDRIATVTDFARFRALSTSKTCTALISGSASAQKQAALKVSRVAKT